MRLFLAAELDDAVRRALAAAIEELRGSGPRVRWVAPENLHLTLKFCGEMADPEPLARAVRSECASAGAADLRVAGLGQFPPVGHAQVLWAGCHGEMGAIAEACERAALLAGVPRDRFPFEAHITIGRARERRDARGLKEVLARFASREFGLLHVDAVTLFSSDLRPDGPVYTVVERIALNRTPGASV